VFVFVFSRRRGGGEEEEEGEEAPTSTFQKCWEVYGYGVCVPSFLPFFSFLYVIFSRQKTQSPFNNNTLPPPSKNAKKVLHK
jgi:hypothetical protein